jgi:hypothetical protein
MLLGFVVLAHISTDQGQSSAIQLATVGYVDALGLTKNVKCIYLWFSTRNVFMAFNSQWMIFLELVGSEVLWES